MDRPPYAPVREQGESSHTRASAAPEASGSFTEPVSSLSSRFVPELMLRVPPTSRDYYCWPIRGHERRRPALPLFTFHGTTSVLFLPLQSLLPEVIIPEAEPEASSRSRCHVRRCAAVSQSGALEGEMADWTRAPSSGAVEEILDRENKRMADSLASKVTRLKSVSDGPFPLRVVPCFFWWYLAGLWVKSGWSEEKMGAAIHVRPCLTLLSLYPNQLALDIDRDTEDQNRYLDGMDSDFTSVTGLLTGSVKRFSTMARSGRDNRKLLCGMAMVLIVAFFILYHLLSRTRT
ncbi:Bet1 golgi vesicular membrane trafficking protein like [Cricetulus griseus]